MSYYENILLARYYCQNLSGIKRNTDVKKISVHSLEIKDIHVKYDEKSIMKNISFSINGSEIVAITGANRTGNNPAYYKNVGFHTQLFCLKF